jgi:hypothetical protein
MSIDIAHIEKRLASVETALTQVQQKLGLTPSPGNWVEQVSGSLADIPEDDYQRFLECCKAVRAEGSAEEAGP